MDRSRRLADAARSAGGRRSQRHRLRRGRQSSVRHRQALAEIVRNRIVKEMKISSLFPVSSSRGVSFNWELETGNWQLATGNWKLVTGNWLLLIQQRSQP